MKTLDDIKPGQTIGRYEFLVPIASGGMAAVWAARLKGTHGFSRTVAIKTMLPALSDDPLFEQMFLDEARFAAQIHHPHVAEIMDLGEEVDVLYIVMEYVDGESIATILRAVGKKQRQIPMPIAVQMMIDACNGLHAAHELKGVDGKDVGLVHRDISPQNILTTYDGVVKIVDFGVAKAAGRTSSDTTAGQIKGKAPYMSPEQAQGHPVDRRTDIYALGIVLYQITTGKHPFRGESDVATLYNILHRELPSPRFVDPKYPRALEAILQKALSRDVNKRFQTAAEMADALGRVFPPTVRRVTPSDVSKFLHELMGEIGEKRREALREAIRQADTRTSDTSKVTLTYLPALSDVESGVSSPTLRRELNAITEPTTTVAVAPQIAPEPVTQIMAPPILPGERISAPLPSFPLDGPGSTQAAKSVIVAENDDDESDAPTEKNPALELTSPRFDNAFVKDPEFARLAEVRAESPNRRKLGVVAGVAVGVLVVALLVMTGAKRRRERLNSSVPPVQSNTAPLAVSVVSVAPTAPDASPAVAESISIPAYDLEAVSRLLPKPWENSSPRRSSGDSNKKTGSQPDGGIPSGWKPPPVTDPGF